MVVVNLNLNSLFLNKFMTKILMKSHYAVVLKVYYLLPKLMEAYGFSCFTYPILPFAREQVLFLLNCFHQYNHSELVIEVI